jgi:hypothetical protein
VMSDENKKANLTCRELRIMDIWQLSERNLLQIWLRYCLFSKEEVMEVVNSEVLGMVLEFLLDVTERETPHNGNSDTQTQMNEYRVISLVLLETWRSA